MMKYEITIGLETHIMQKTKTKMFCGCKYQYGAVPNTNICSICLGYPGALPNLNKHAIELCCKAGLLLGCEINLLSSWDRKNYFYPDMSKNYQITQNEYPLCIDGEIKVNVLGKIKTFQIERIHQEENAAKNTHINGTSYIDYNRAGTALMEIVSTPCMHSAADAVAYMMAIKQIMQYAEISDCNQEKGQMRSDVNISVRLFGDEKLGSKVEIKNMNSFSFINDAINFEVQRQIDILESGGTVNQETRGYDSDRGETFLQRSKEDAHDYRYFPEPDLLPLKIEKEQISKWYDELPELPSNRKERYINLGLPEYDSGILTSSKEIADWFEEVLSYTNHIKLVSNFIMTDIIRLISVNNISILNSKITPKIFAEIINLNQDSTISNTSARELIDIIFVNGGNPNDIIEENQMIQVSDDSALEDWVDAAINSNLKAVQEYKNGNQSSINFIMGQVMKASKGKANPGAVMEMLKGKLN
mgnify:CR=1 FL=1